MQLEKKKVSPTIRNRQHNKYHHVNAIKIFWAANECSPCTSFPSYNIGIRMMKLNEVLFINVRFLLHLVEQININFDEFKWHETRDCALNLIVLLSGHSIQGEFFSFSQLKNSTYLVVLLHVTAFFFIWTNSSTIQSYAIKYQWMRKKQIFCWYGILSVSVKEQSQENSIWK